MADRQRDGQSLPSLHPGHHANRYEKASTVLTSNKAFSDWTELFHDQVIVTAILDRLLHHSVVINIKGNSFRLRGKISKDEADSHGSIGQGW
jgi:hypothetical protein